MTSPIRNSVAASTATVVLVGLAAVASTPACAGRQARQHYDVLIAGGTVYDGLGGPGVRADVGMAGDEIKAVGDLRCSWSLFLWSVVGLLLAQCPGSRSRPLPPF
jgi:hypothetical protein